jgi:hypothetical protein
VIHTQLGTICSISVLPHFRQRSMAIKRPLFAVGRQPARRCPGMKAPYIVTALDRCNSTGMCKARPDLAEPVEGFVAVRS